MRKKMAIFLNQPEMQEPGLHVAFSALPHINQKNKTGKKEKLWLAEIYTSGVKN
jgi:hypothetical protein